MKKYLSSFAAGLFLLFSVAANAQVVPPAISTSDEIGKPGDTVKIDISLVNGSIAFGGDFTISYESSELKFLGITGKNGFFSPFFLEPFNSGDAFSLTQEGDPDAAIGPIENIFTIIFEIISPYPAAFPDDSIVGIGGYLWADELQTSEVFLSSIASTVTVSAGNDGTIPEPGVLALVALGLLIMTGVGRRSRLFR